MKKKEEKNFEYMGQLETKSESLARIKDGNLHKLIDKVCEKIPSL